MPKRPVLKVVKVNYTPSAPWMVRVPDQLQKIEAAKKKFLAWLKRARRKKLHFRPLEEVLADSPTR